MKVLVVGGGAREHALCWKLASDSSVSEVVCAPGSAGIAEVARCAAADPANPSEIRALVERERIDLTVVGPELPLTRGVANELASAGHAACGPSREAAALEASKAFAKDFMSRHRVPTARYEICDTSSAALDVVRGPRFGFPVVLKADGLAAGKGVVVAPDLPHAEAAIRDIMVDRRFGDAGARLVVEECLQGREASFFVLTDGQHSVVLPSAEDHKRVFDGDLGPNTGGMGAFSPSPLVDDAMRDRVLGDIVDPVLDGMRAEGRPYRGFLYVGLMLTAEGPKVIEFNVRLGDPETQVMLPRIAEDLAPLLEAAARGSLGVRRLLLRPECHIGVVLASGGYPDRFESGKPIAGLDAVEALGDVRVFHSGTARRDAGFATAGGRVVTLVAGGSGFAAARARAYQAAALVHFDGMHYRRDIGMKALSP
jgi:phosphoribosylamine--glycine ligase